MGEREGTHTWACTHIHAQAHTLENESGHRNMLASLGKEALCKRTSLREQITRQYLGKGIMGVSLSQGLPEYSTGKRGAPPAQLQVKEPRVLRQDAPGSQSCSWFSHSS